MYFWFYRCCWYPRFDGGYSPTIKSNLSTLINSLQPNAAVFQGYGVAKNPLRWIGTEAGTAPYPNWSSNNGNKAGGGAYDGTDFVPGEVDTTLQEGDQVGGSQWERACRLSSRSRRSI